MKFTIDELLKVQSVVEYLEKIKESLLNPKISDLSLLLEETKHLRVQMDEIIQKGLWEVVYENDGGLIKGICNYFNCDNMTTVRMSHPQEYRMLKTIFGKLIQEFPENSESEKKKELAGAGLKRGEE